MAKTPGTKKCLAITMASFMSGALFAFLLAHGYALRLSPWVVGLAEMGAKLFG